MLTKPVQTCKDSGRTQRHPVGGCRAPAHDDALPAAAASVTPRGLAATQAQHDPRVAIYYAPALHDPLWSAAAAWLGRDPETAATVPQPDLPGIHGITASARLYGFHCTLKPPMRLRTGYTALLDDAASLAGRLPSFDLPPLAVSDVSGFLALRETTPCPALRHLADACVTGLDHHRAPPTAAELARRRAGGLTPARDALLQRWGYPLVFDEWFFHMTLTRRLTPDERATYLPAAQAHFAAAIPSARRVDAICIFTQPAEDRPFILAERLPLRG